MARTTSAGLLETAPPCTPLERLHFQQLPQSQRGRLRAAYNLNQAPSRFAIFDVSFEVAACRPDFPSCAARLPPRSAGTGSFVDGFGVSYPCVLYLPRSRRRSERLALCAQRARALAEARPVVRARVPFVEASASPTASEWGGWLGELHLPHVVSVVGSDLQTRNVGRPPRVAAIETCLREATLILAKSRALRDSLRRLRFVARRVIVDYDGVDQALFCPRPRAEACALLGESPEPRRILFVGDLRACGTCPCSCQPSIV